MNKIDRAPKHNLHLNRPLWWVSQGVKKYKKRNQEQPSWMETLPTALSPRCLGREGFPGSWPTLLFLLWRMCLPQGVFQLRARDTQFPSFTFPLHPLGIFHVFWKKKQNTTSQLLTNMAVSNRAPFPGERLSIQMSTNPF